ncbi:MAG: GTPase ObgE [Candidatus Kapaibacterium sp.]
MKFVDTAKVFVKSGDGGPGHISFRREKYVPKGGPDGGNGGRGGDVVAIGDPHMNTLLDFHYKRHFKADRGDEGGKSRKSGKSGKDARLRLPVGTIIRRIDNGEVIADVTEPGEEIVIAKGGRGGLGNSEFATPTNQAPRYAQPGEPGEEFEVELELKLIADVGIVGMPNAGKSTLISVISAAKPKIAEYPFTTLIPNLGIVKMGEHNSYTVADIPGLIEGAHEGKGLGIQFLRHIERTRALVFMIDPMSPDPAQDYEILRTELYKYNPDMEFKKYIVCISKIDALDEEGRAKLDEIDFGEPADKIMRISSVTGENIEELKWRIWNMLEES